MFDLKRFRKDFKLKQSELQDILGIPQSFISKIENGKEPFPQIHYDKLCDRFGEGAVKKYKTDEENSNSINIVGDGNVTNTGITGGDVIIGADQEIKALKKRIKELEEENKELKNDKAILQEFVTFLQNKK